MTQPLVVIVTHRGQPVYSLAVPSLLEAHRERRAAEANGYEARIEPKRDLAQAVPR